MSDKHVDINSIVPKIPCVVIDFIFRRKESLYNYKN